MINNEQDYQAMKKRLEQDQHYINDQYQSYKEMGFDEEQIQRVMEPSNTLREQMEKEILEYEKTRDKYSETVTNFNELGQLLIELRIAKGLTQKELAERTGLSENQISHYEQNEYQDLPIVRVECILNSLGKVLISKLENKLESKY